ncbi:RNA polymerase sigma factor [Actinocorallia lasiicapitis]
MESDRFTRLFERHYDEVLRYVWRRAPADDVEDTVGEVFGIAWRRIADVPDGHELPWLYVTARHVIANRYRSRDRRGSVGLPLPSHPDPADGVAERSVALAALRRLGGDDRELIMLVAWEGLDAPAIGEMLGITVSAVHVRLHRARKRLEQHLAEGEVRR